MASLSSPLACTALMASGMSLMKESLPHEILYIDSSSEASEISESEASGESSTIALLSLWIIVASHIVHSPSFWVFEKLISIGYFFELLFSSRIGFVAIWVVLSRPFFESLSNLIFSCILPNSQHFVGVWDLSCDFRQHS
jgi:hypothetical protein